MNELMEGTLGALPDVEPLERRLIDGFPIFSYEPEVTALDHAYVYLLELTQGRWYVGYSKSPLERLKKHIAGSGALWTQLYQPTGQIFVVEHGSDLSELGISRPASEIALTLEAMGRFGINNVRGSVWVSLKLSPEQMDDIHHAMSELGIEERQEIPF